MKTAVIGLGLIGGSMAKAFKDNTDSEVYGLDINESVMLKAKLVGAIDGELTDDILAQCDRVIIALYPESTVEFLQSKADMIKKGAVVIDCSGVKRYVFTPAHELAKAHGFEFIGGHPMAGVERWGFGMLFNNASMILTPDGGTDIALLHEIKQMFLSIGFGSITVVSPEQHDRIIAYTSQLAHVVASAYIKSPTALEHTGMSAGSYKDMTRVASLNSNMWSELFLENGDNLLNEIDNIINNLTEYRDAIASNDRVKLEALLEDGTKRKAICG
jgi:prephenate dehydrogenase